MRSLCVIALSIALAGCGGPLWMLPGGALDGSESPAPAAWNSVPDTIQVEFRPGGNAYSINIWAVGIERDLYIATGDDGTRWSAMLESDREVRVRVGDRLHPLRAAAVDAADERARVTAAFHDKYGTDPEDGFVVDGLIFRLDRRT